MGLPASLLRSVLNDGAPRILTTALHGMMMRRAGLCALRYFTGSIGRGLSEPQAHWAWCEPQSLDSDAHVLAELRESFKV